jgi:hypothetical protein
MSLKTWLFCGGLLAASWAARSESIYTFNLNAFTYGGQSFAAAQFTVGVADPVPSMPEPLETSSVYDGLVVSSLGVAASGPSEFMLAAFNAAVNPLDGDPRGPTGTIVGLFTPWITGFDYKDGPLTLDGPFAVLVSDGCMTPTCGTGWNAVNVQGTMSEVAAPEPGTSLLLGAGLAAVAFARSRRRRTAPSRLR